MDAIANNVNVGPRRPSQYRDKSNLEIPNYLRDTYNWAYLNPRNVALLDHELIVSVILWGQHRRLQRAAFSELAPGLSVLQPAAVYGDFSPALARHLGPRGHLDVTDIAPVQVANCRKKLEAFPHATVQHADARSLHSNADATIAPDLYDAVCCYFLLHELPIDCKHEVVDALLANIVPGGRVVFVDYHKPHWAHPLKPVTSVIFDSLEPFAKDLWHNDVASYASEPSRFSWRTDLYFGGLFQKVVAERPR